MKLRMHVSSYFVLVSFVYLHPSFLIHHLFFQTATRLLIYHVVVSTNFSRVMTDIFVLFKTSFDIALLLYGLSMPLPVAAS